MRCAIRALAAALLLAGCQSPPPPAPDEASGESARRRALREAEVWHPVDTARLDVRLGPEDGRDPAVPVECSFVVPLSHLGGNTPKFPCREPGGGVIKVKYGPDNMEVPAEVFGSRLLWLLGFHSDRIDPVRVRCRGCPEDPWDFLQSLDPSDPRPAPPAEGVREFAPAIVETYYGERIEAHPGQGLPWPQILAELSPDPVRAAEQRIHREALTLLAAFIGHGDSKADNQTLACAPGGGDPARCTHPVIYVGDLGAILGRGVRLVTTKVDIEAWEGLDLWRDHAACIARFHTHRFGTLHDTPISEPARAFLAERLSALRREQIRALFEVAGLDGLGGEIEDEDGSAHPPTLDDWVRIFESKRRQITEHRCPAAG